jgi:DNA-binding NarL/FixJ family response regulator
MIRVVLVDDQELVRTGFRMIVDAQPDMTVVGEASDGAAAVDEVLRCRPDVVLMDVRMPGVDGIEATRRLVRSSVDARFVMLTTFDLDDHLYDAMRAGASGFLLKTAPSHQLIAAVRDAAAGDLLVAPEITRRLVQEFVQRPRPSVDGPVTLGDLTPRELEVLRLVARGLSNAELARELFVSEATAKTHVARILAKLGLRDRVQAVVLAYESGLVRPGGC